MFAREATNRPAVASLFKVYSASDEKEGGGRQLRVQWTLDSSSYHGYFQYCKIGEEEKANLANQIS